MCYKMLNAESTNVTCGVKATKRVVGDNTKTQNYTADRFFYRLFMTELATNSVQLHSVHLPIVAV